MILRPPRRTGARPCLVILSVVMVAGALAPVARAEGIPVTVVTLKGESIEGKFVGATSAQVTVETPSRIVTFSLQDVSYISFGGHPPAAGAVSYATPTTPSSQLRADGMVSEAAGRFLEALRKYEEAAKLDPSDPLTTRALERARRKISAQEAARKAAPYKKLAAALRDQRRYGEASACYDEALRLDPSDQAFRESLKGVRHYWEPTTCPVPQEPMTGK